MSLKLVFYIEEQVYIPYTVQCAYSNIALHLELEISKKLVEIATLKVYALIAENVKFKLVPDFLILFKVLLFITFSFIQIMYLTRASKLSSLCL